VHFAFKCNEAVEGLVLRAEKEHRHVTGRVIHKYEDVAVPVKRKRLKRSRDIHVDELARSRERFYSWSCSLCDRLASALAHCAGLAERRVGDGEIEHGGEGAEVDVTEPLVQEKDIRRGST
jgi:hypothetical protein